MVKKVKASAAPAARKRAAAPVARKTKTRAKAVRAASVDDERHA